MIPLWIRFIAVPHQHVTDSKPGFDSFAILMTKEPIRGRFKLLSDNTGGMSGTAEQSESADTQMP
jgi:hypothetical protein